MRRKLHTLLCAALLVCAALRAEEPAVEPRIAGLEGNAEYMALLREDARLQQREDSIVNAVARTRRLLRESPADDRQRHSREILEMESRIFELRNAKGRVIDRINAIEQEWVLANLDAPAASGKPGDTPPATPARQHRNLIYNRCFREQLPTEDYAALRRAQRMEMQAVDYVNRYLTNYGTVADLAAAYEAARSESEALDIQDRIEALRNTNLQLSDSLARTWNYIFDNKSYAYAYMLDRLGRDDLLAREEEQLEKATSRLAEIGEASDSRSVTDYFLRKRVVVDYECRVAEALELKAAGDSLRGVAAQLANIDPLMPKVEVKERHFLVYDTIAFSKTPKYTYQNPIPECKVYARGTIYRILLGTFNTKRAAATFRGAYPLFYLINDEGKWCYYTGGFATREEADAAQKRLKKHGFIRPEVVVWVDGTSTNLSQEAQEAQEAQKPERQQTAYRIEVSGSDTLPEEIRRQIDALTGGIEISRAGRNFLIGTFDDRAVAEQVAEAIRTTAPALQIKLEETGK